MGEGDGVIKVMGESEVMNVNVPGPWRTLGPWGNVRSCEVRGERVARLRRERAGAVGDFGAAGERAER